MDFDYIDTDLTLFHSNDTNGHIFQDVFERQDRHRDGEIELDKVLLGFSKMGGNATEDELRKWAKETNKDGRTQKSFNFVDFVLAYANIFHPTRRGGAFGGSGSGTMGSTDRSDRSHDDDKALGKSLRLSGDFKALGGFARAFGKKQLRDLERAFDVHAQRDVHGNTYLRAANILDVFHQLGRAITVTRLQEWMEDADVRPQDLLSLADFTSMFAFFFSPGGCLSTHPVNTHLSLHTLSWPIMLPIITPYPHPSHNTLLINSQHPYQHIGSHDFSREDNAHHTGTSTHRGEGKDGDSDDLMGEPSSTIISKYGKMTLSEVAVQVLQEERWRGSVDQTNAFVRRLCAGRSEAIAACVGRYGSPNPLNAYLAITL